MTSTLHHFSRCFYLVFLSCLPCFVTQLHTKTVLPKKQNKNTAPRHRKVDQKPIKKQSANQVKEWNFYLYIAGENNLAWFVDVNCEQMARIGSNENITLLCSIDRFAGGPLYRAQIDKATQDHNGINQVWKSVDQPDYTKNERQYHSGTPESLFSFLKWGIETYPAKKHCLIIWNHGSGILDPMGWGRIINEFHNQMFFTDPETGVVSLIRETELMGPKKGIAFNDSRGTFLDNQALVEVLSAVAQATAQNKHPLNNGKFDLIAMDACCMANIEVATQLKQFTDYLVFSQEVVLGAGLNYEYTLQRVSQESLTPEQLCLEFIKAYEKEYYGVISYYTMAAVDFTHTQTSASGSPRNTFALIEDELNELATELISIIKTSRKGSAVRTKIRHIRNKPHLTTGFHSNKYIDLRKFLRALNIGMQATLDHEHDKNSRRKILSLTSHICDLICDAVPFFTAGSMFGASPSLDDQVKHRASLAANPSSYLHKEVKGDYSRARGLSIYFPTRDIHASYSKTIFAQNNAWFDFLELILNRHT